MKINNLATLFLESYEALSTYYEQYFKNQPEAYEFYINFHCNNKEEQLQKALLQHPPMLNKMKDVTKKLERNIKEITTEYKNVQYHHYR